MLRKQSSRKLEKPMNFCVKDLEMTKTKAVKAFIPLPPPLEHTVDCHIEKPKRKIKVLDETETANCNRPNWYRTPAEKRTFLETKVTPVLMEGMLGLARDQPEDPISYLEEFWLKKQHKCNIKMPQNLL